MKKKGKMDIAFEKALNSEYDKIIVKLKYSLNEKNNITKKQKINYFRDNLIEELGTRFKYQYGKLIGQIDPYIAKIIKVFSERKSKSKNSFVTYFFENDFFEIKEIFNSKSSDLKNHTVYSMRQNDTLHFLATYLATCIFLKDTVDIDLQNEDETDSILETILNKDSINNESFDQFAISFEGINNDEESPRVLIENKKNKEIEIEFTLQRQVLVMHYIFSELGVRGIDTTEKARFVQLLTGKELNAKSIKNTNTYKRMRNPFPLSDKQLLKDLQFVRNYFEKLGLAAIVNKINREIEKNK